MGGFRVHHALAATLVLATSLLSGCATTGAGSQDPLESFNRSMFKFNDAIDRALFKPVATTYVRVTPGPVKTAVQNFFANAFEPTVLVNDLLQGKLTAAVASGGRFLINTTIGLLGILDVASKMGLEKQDEDFGQTFGRWGIGPGPYLVVPFFGPTTLRDGVGTVIYYSYLYPFLEVPSDDTARIAIAALSTVQTRASLLSLTKILDEAALDPYVFTRESYLQRRVELIYDGDPPLDLLLDE